MIKDIKNDIAEIKGLLVELLQKQPERIGTPNSELMSLARGVANGDRTIMRKYNRRRC